MCKWSFRVKHYRWNKTKVVSINYLHVRVSASQKHVKQETHVKKPPARKVHATFLKLNVNYWNTQIRDWWQ